MVLSTKLFSAQLHALDYKFMPQKTRNSRRKGQYSYEQCSQYLDLNPTGLKGQSAAVVWFVSAWIVPFPNPLVTAVVVVFLIHYRSRTIWLSITRTVNFRLVFTIETAITVAVLGNLTVRQRSCGKIMFLVVSVCPWGVSHVTITYDALDLTVQGPHASSAPYRSCRVHWMRGH